MRLTLNYLPWASVVYAPQPNYPPAPPPYSGEDQVRKLKGG